MGDINWKEFLAEYSIELARNNELLDWAEVPEEARKARWFGYPPATYDQIIEAEDRLGIQLPNDIREFYGITNGWMICGNTIYDIMPIEEVCLYSKGEPELWSISEVDSDPPDDELGREIWYETGIKVCRSIMLNRRGDDSTLLYDPGTYSSEDELRFGDINAWNPGIQWTAISLGEYFLQSRETFRYINSSESDEADVE